MALNTDSCDSTEPHYSPTMSSEEVGGFSRLRGLEAERQQR